MLFRMGPSERLPASDFSVPLCRSSVGVVTDELPASVPLGRRLFFFHTRAWTPEAYRAVMDQARRWVVPTGLDSCSIGPPEPVFSTARVPSDAPAFVRGQIGVIRPACQLRYLIGAYRTLQSGKLTDEQASAIIPSPPSQAVLQSADASAQGAAAWNQARSKVQGVKPADPVWNSYREKNRDGSITFYRNCLDDAFDTARQTLKRRSAQWGPGDPRLQAWVAAQDRVFRNCGGREAEVPDVAAPSTDSLLAADREYQVAAAYFYAGKDTTGLAASSDLADWLVAFEGDMAWEKAGHHAMERWHRDGSPAWLVTALLRAPDQDAAAEILRAARQLKPGEPAYESATYYGIAREIRNGNRDLARAWADEALKQRLLLSSRNLILGERLKLAARKWRWKRRARRAETIRYSMRTRPIPSTGGCPSRCGRKPPPARGFRPVCNCKSCNRGGCAPSCCGRTKARTH
jgi:hypothetical protein